MRPTGRADGMAATLDADHTRTDTKGRTHHHTKDTPPARAAQLVTTLTAAPLACPYSADHPSPPLPSPCLPSPSWHTSCLENTVLPVRAA